MMFETAQRTLLALAAMSIMASSAPGQTGLTDDEGTTPDRVTLLTNEGTGRMTLTCRVVDYTGKTIRLRLRTGNAVRDYDAELVVDVRTPQAPSHLDGIDKFRQKEYPAARESLESALEVENRTWVRREILALLVRCSLREGNRVLAGNRFLALCQSDPETRHFSLAPLAWGIEDVDPEWKAAARLWKTQNKESAELLTASALLMDPAHQVESEIALKRLATSTSGSISALAGQQLWRKRVADGDVTREEVDRWHARVLATSERLRGGGFFVAGSAYRLRKEHDRAAACLMWAPLAFAEDPYWAAESELLAALSLQQIGQKAEARTLLLEVRDRFSATPSALEASRRLKEND